MDDINHIEINKSVLEDARLSWTAKGIFAYISCEDAEYNFDSFDIDRRSLFLAAKELVDLGYITVRQETDLHIEITSYLLVPFELWCDYNLTPSEKLIWMEINMHTQASGYRTLFSDEGFSHLVNDSPAEVKKMIKNLIALGYLIERPCSDPDSEINKKYGHTNVKELIAILPSQKSNQKTQGEEE